MSALMDLIERINPSAILANRDHCLVMVVFLGALVIFALDLFVPLGVAVGVLYITLAPILLKTKESKWNLVLAAFSPMLTILALAIQTEATTSWMVYCNRTISVIAIWTTAIIIAIHKKEEADAESERQRQDRDLQEFRFAASHDLQEPLCVISSFADLLTGEYENSLDDTARESLKFIRHSSTRMRMLIKDVLLYSRISDPMKAENIRLADVMTEVVEELEEPLNRAGANIRIEELPQVRGCRQRLKLLFKNLVANAIKFRDVERPLTIRVFARRSARRKDGSMAGWCVTIEDNGIGVTAENNARIFKLFQTLHGRESNQGNGVGLSLCRKIVEMHGGRLWVESNGSDGSAFHFTLQEKIEL